MHSWNKLWDKWFPFNRKNWLLECRTGRKSEEWRYRGQRLQQPWDIEDYLKILGEGEEEAWLMTIVVTQ